MTPIRHITRRSFIVGASGAIVGSRVGWAQQAKLPVVGYLGVTAAGSPTSNLGYLLEGLKVLGYVEGRDFVLEVRSTDGDTDRGPGLARELVALNPRVIVSASVTGSQALKAVTDSIPIVMASGSDAVRAGLVSSLAYPGGNITGVTVAEGVVGKQMELAHELAPGATAIGLLLNAGNATYATARGDAELAASALGVAPVRAEYRVVGDVDGAFRALADASVAIAILPSDSLALSERERFVSIALRTHVPVVCNAAAIVEVGGFVSYGADSRATNRRAAVWVDKILKGAKPADLPVELMSPLLAINLMTARKLGMSIPSSVLARADEVIEQ